MCFNLTDICHKKYSQILLFLYPSDPEINNIIVGLNTKKTELRRSDRTWVIGVYILMFVFYFI